jgi:hypothetical protein
MQSQAWSHHKPDQGIVLMAQIHMARSDKKIQIFKYLDNQPSECTKALNYVHA